MFFLFPHQNMNTPSPDKAHSQMMWVNGPIIVGAGPLGLATFACLLHNHSISSLILEKSDCIASLWQHRAYDRLRLHLPKKFCELPLFSFPEDFPRYPSKEQFISYLEQHAVQFGIEPIFGQEVGSAEYLGECRLWRVETGEATYVSRWLICRNWGECRTFEGRQCHRTLEWFRGKVVHSSEYKSGREYRGRRVLVIGCGNSSMEVCLDLCRHNACPYMVARNSVRPV